MPFIQNILKNKSISIVGMAKNTGKTTCLNYVLKRLEEENRKVAVTSIGVDGEERDVLYDTPKPRILLKKGNYFITSEKHFEERELEAKILTVSNKTTALGRLITAQVEKEGRIILSGPSDSIWLQSCIKSMSDFAVDITVVDGALSRMSLASPAITDAMILCTGAACSIQLEQLIKKVKYLCNLINIQQVSDDLYEICEPISEGIWKLTVENITVANHEKNDNFANKNDFAKNKNATVSEINTTVNENNQIKNEIIAEKIANSLFLDDKFMLEFFDKSEANKSQYFYINGALTDNFLKILTAIKKVSEIKLIVRDFSRIFVQPSTFQRFTRRGGNIQVLQKAKLLAICTNPTSPEGYNFEPEILRNSIQKELNIPVFDIIQEQNRKK